MAARRPFDLRLHAGLQRRAIRRRGGREHPESDARRLRVPDRQRRLDRWIAADPGAIRGARPEDPPGLPAQHGIPGGPQRDARRRPGRVHRPHGLRRRGAARAVRSAVVLPPSPSRSARAGHPDRRGQPRGGPAHGDVRGAAPQGDRPGPPRRARGHLPPHGDGPRRGDAQGRGIPAGILHRRGPGPLAPARGDRPAGQPPRTAPEISATHAEHRQCPACPAGGRHHAGRRGCPRSAWAVPRRDPWPSPHRPGRIPPGRTTCASGPGGR